MAESITHVLLDIEGTTCPVDFVANTLFPYASTHLKAYMLSHGHEAPVEALLQEVREAWRLDHKPPAPAAGATNVLMIQNPGVEALADYLIKLIEQDRKLPALKELQGLVWEEGYSHGAIQAPLFPEVTTCLQQWRQQGLVLGAYSSGSVTAQQLLYGHTLRGDLRPLFSAWFDTRTGAKQSSSSYRRISEIMGAEPASVLFVSDSCPELTAAHGAGMEVAFSDREGNPNREAKGFPRITSLEQLSPMLLGRRSPR
ncbi:acireductone synthase [Synechococcus sp. Tobar12-5m-g]|jgi:enolase-phosphatase E1|uniref:acireductone synthase n=1 Tax=unclassified Synechococcus TaxID=2626047 RepID=UPI0020CCF77C|nr:MULTISPECIES: acireductone synthase [unclassified Synechococcus]MCP9773311.1 acireductone synthase [Synechococcus sp. Tobar12-5m-g]MCP9874203.1 acireductone synthase [Synechococcus sp. Cruz CV-v-12]